MSVLLYVLLLGLFVAAGSLDPRRIPRRSELGKVLRRVGRPARREIDSALREGRAVGDPRLASLAAAVAQERMNRIDYRGPLLKQEKLFLLAGIGEVALTLVLGVHHLASQEGNIGGSVLAVFWVVGFRRLTPSHRHSTDRMLTAYKRNVSLGESVGPGEASPSSSGYAVTRGLFALLLIGVDSDRSRVASPLQVTMAVDLGFIQDDIGLTDKFGGCGLG